MPKKKPIWTPFERAYLPLPKKEKLQIMVKVVSEDMDIPEVEAIDHIKEVLSGDEVYLNNLYQVNIRREHIPSWDSCIVIVHLSIKRIDKAPIRDWRHFQRIKNELVGKDCEGAELYPAENRVVDTSNQYHLWVFEDPKFRFPFGFTQGTLKTSKETAAKVGAKQREFEK